MLSCNVGKTNVNTIDYDEKQLRAWSKKKILKCPVCGEVLVYKHGLVKIPHFAHEKDSECTYTFYENETKEHVLGKVLLYKWLKGLDVVSNLELESYIKETKQRPDLYFEIEEQRYVIEYQCSPITLEEFLERKELYKLNGIIDIWILGVENCNFTIGNKIIPKVLEKHIFQSGKQKVYYLDPFKETFYKIYQGMVDLSGLYYLYNTQDINNLNNLFIQDNNIFFDFEISNNFLKLLDKNIKDEELKIEEFQYNQKMLYWDIIDNSRLEDKKIINNLSEKDLLDYFNTVCKYKTIYFYKESDIYNKNCIDKIYSNDNFLIIDKYKGLRQFYKEIKYSKFNIHVLLDNYSDLFKLAIKKLSKNNKLIKRWRSVKWEL